MIEGAAGNDTNPRVWGKFEGSIGRRFSALNEAAQQVLISDQLHSSLTMIWTDYMN